jgi:hypothetical protein
MLAIWRDAATLDAWRTGGGLEEAFIDVPLKLIALGVVVGAVGAALGKGGAKTLAQEARDAGNASPQRRQAISARRFERVALVRWPRPNASNR